jgi:hypothetical protein
VLLFNGSMTPFDPAAILNQLRSQELRTRLAQLDRERSALIILLRAALAQERRRRSSKRSGVSRA